jgi:hypothetical protein
MIFNRRILDAPPLAGYFLLAGLPVQILQKVKFRRVYIFSKKWDYNKII